jgi:hypothetical protein
MAVNQHHWSPSDRQATRSTPGMLELDSLTFMKMKLETIQNQISQLSVSKVNQVTHSLSCEIYGVMEHTALECPLSIPQENLENVNMLNNFNRPQNNPYSQSYNPGWRNHPNFSYKNNQGTVSQIQNRPQQGFAPTQNVPQQ